MSVNSVRRSLATVRQTTKGRKRDLLLYVLIGVGLVVASALVAVFTKVDIDSMFKWLGFIGATGIAFGDAIRTNRRHWRTRRLWLLLGIFLLVECALVIPLLSTVTQFPAIYWALFLPFNAGVLAAYVAFFMDMRG